MKKYSWAYDEFKQVGKDYSQVDEVQVYDSSHSDFRDIKQESNQVLDKLGITKDDLLIDIGSGTGTFAIEAALRCKKAYAVDVSKAMIDYAKEKAKGVGVNNLQFIHGGFLSFECDCEVDFITTTFAFHHLPDFWKGIALKRIYGMLKPGGKLFIHDVIVQKDGALENISNLIDKLGKAGGDFMRMDCETHFKEEFSTYDWVMDGLLESSGFIIESKIIDEGLIGSYICYRPR